MTSRLLLCLAVSSLNVAAADWPEWRGPSGQGVATIAKLPEMLNNIRVPVEVTLATPLWLTPWVFAAILLLLLGEWALRRKGGMA